MARKGRPYETSSLIRMSGLYVFLHGVGNHGTTENMVAFPASWSSLRVSAYVFWRQSWLTMVFSRHWHVAIFHLSSCQLRPVERTRPFLEASTRPSCFAAETWQQEAAHSLSAISSSLRVTLFASRNMMRATSYA